MSTLLHVALFAYLARVVPILPTPTYAPAPNIELELAPAPSLVPSPAPFAAPRQARSNQRQATRSSLTVASRPAPARAQPPARTIQSLPRPLPQRAPAAAPAPPAAASASIPSTGARTGANAGAGAAGGGGGHTGIANLPGDEERDGVREFLRATVGCSHEEYLHLTAPERAACDRRVGRDARAVANAKVEGIPSEKRAYYDAVQQAYQALHDPRTPVDTTAGGMATTGQGGHGLSFGCKAGSCGVNLPQGVLTEESGVPKP